MTETKIHFQSPQPETQELTHEDMRIPEEWRVELDGLSGDERAEHESVIRELLAEMAVSEAIQAEASRHIAEARSYGKRGNGKSHESSARKFAVDMKKIGWLESENQGEVSVETVESPNLKYYFADMTDMHRVTKSAREDLRRQGEDEKLTTLLKEEKIPIMWQKVLHGSSEQRSISIGNREVKDVPASRSLNTTFPAFKLDVLGTNNRAIILKLGEVEGVPVFALAALYDHEAQDHVLNTLFLKKNH